MVVPLSAMNPFSSSTEDPRVRPRRMSDLAVNCAVYAMHLVVPTNIERGAIAVPLNIRESLRERAVERGLRRGGGSSAMHGGYDPLKSPPPGTVLEGSSEGEAGRDEKAEKKAAKVEVVEKEPDEEDV